MATFVPPKINTQFVYYSALVAQSDTRTLKSNPTIAAGDFKTSLDGGALGNLGTLPTVTPASSVMVKFTLATTETNGGNFTIVSIDAAGAEWCDRCDNFQTSARQIDDLAFPNTSGRGQVIDANGLADANVVKIGPTGSGTAQTARDIGASVLLSAGSGAGQLDFTSGVVKSNVTQWTGNNVAATSVNGVPIVDVKYFLGTAITEGGAGRIAGRFTGVYDAASNGYSAATVMSTYAGGAVASVTAGVTVTTNNDKTGYSLTQTFPANFSSLAITGGGSVTAGTVSDKTGYALSATGMDVAIVEGSTTWSQSARGWNSALLGKGSGLATTSAKYRDIADSKDRITATVDADGNRSAITLDLT